MIHAADLIALTNLSHVIAAVLSGGGSDHTTVHWPFLSAYFDFGGIGVVELTESASEVANLADVESATFILKEGHKPRMDSPDCSKLLRLDLNQ